MLIEHQGYQPDIHPSAYIAPNSVICGNVKIGKGARIMFGVQIIAENAPVRIGNNCIILENAVVRGTQDHPVAIGNNCLIGPHAHLAGCTIEDNVFLATGVSVFHGAHILEGAEVRINGIVHLNTHVPERSTVPIGWIAVGNPMKLFPPNAHDDIWEVQKALNFPKTVYNIDRDQIKGSKNPDLCRIMSERLGAHKQDKIL